MTWRNLTSLGTPALALARMNKFVRVPFDSLVYLTLVVPEIVIAVASLIFFVQLRHYVPIFPPLGSWTIFLGQVVFGASLAMPQPSSSTASTKKLSSSRVSSMRISPELSAG